MGYRGRNKQPLLKEPTPERYYLRANYVSLKAIMKTNRSKFRTWQNRLMTKALFIELTAPELQDNCLYSISNVPKERNGKIYPSLYELYMAEDDILEHDFARKYFESYAHWCIICESWWMRDIVAQWREELSIRIKSDALKIIRAEADAGTKYAYPAAVYLTKEGWKQPAKVERTNGKVGRPSKAAIAEEAARLAMEQHDYADDLKRLGIEITDKKVIN
jgi:hypothetical protein